MRKMMKEAVNVEMTKFVRDGLQVVEQEEMWIEKRWNILGKNSLSESGGDWKQGMQPFNDNDNENSVKGQQTTDTNLNEGAIKQSLRKTDKEEQKYERMGARNKSKKK